MPPKLLSVFPARRLHQEHSLICARRGGFRSQAGIPFQAQITGGTAGGIR